MASQDWRVSRLDSETLQNPAIRQIHLPRIQTRTQTRIQIQIQMELRVEEVAKMDRVPMEMAPVETDLERTGQAVAATIRIPTEIQMEVSLERRMATEVSPIMDLEPDQP